MRLVYPAVGEAQGGAHILRDRRDIAGTEQPSERAGVLVRRHQRALVLLQARGWTLPKVLDVAAEDGIEASENCLRKIRRGETEDCRYRLGRFLDRLCEREGIDLEG